MIKLVFLYGTCRDYCSVKSNKKRPPQAMYFYNTFYDHDHHNHLQKNYHVKR